MNKVITLFNDLKISPNLFKIECQKLSIEKTIVDRILKKRNEYLSKKEEFIALILK